MGIELATFTGILALLWFLVYWILGGVFFSLMTALQLGRIRKVRFSCIFSILAFLCGFGAAYIGMILSSSSVNTCLAQSTNKAEVITSVFGCGFAGIFGSFLIGALVLVLGGFAIMSISKSKHRPWIVLEHPEEYHPEQPMDSAPVELENEDESVGQSDFF